MCFTALIILLRLACRSKLTPIEKAVAPYTDDESVSFKADSALYSASLPI